MKLWLGVRFLYRNRNLLPKHAPHHKYRTPEPDLGFWLTITQVRTSTTTRRWPFPPHGTLSHVSTHACLLNLIMLTLI